jgi:hypothetical protein
MRHFRAFACGTGIGTLAAGVIASVFASPGSCARADDLGTARLFEQEYRVQRFNYRSSILFPDQKTAGRTVPLHSVTGAVHLGEDRYLVSTNSAWMVPPYSYRNYILEIRLNLGPNGVPTGLSYVRTVLWSDPSLVGYDLDPRGLTINPDPGGLGGGGNLVVACGNNALRQFSLSTGAALPFGTSPLGNGIAITPNTSTEDAVYVPARGMFYTLWRTPESSVTMLTTVGRVGPAFRVGARRPGGRGYPSGVALLEPWPYWPRMFNSATTLLVALDSDGPALEAYDLDSRSLGRVRLSSQLSAGVVTLPLSGSSAQLWISAVAANNQTGRLLLFNKGLTPGEADVFVLTPIPEPCPADYNLDGFVDFFDFDDFVLAFETGDPRADIDADGFVDFLDYDLFSVSYETGC